MPRSKGRTGRPWLRARARVIAEETHCHLCGGWVDKRLSGRHRDGPTVDHIVPLAQGGAPLPPRPGLALAHLRCNSKAKDKRKPRRAPRTSRDW